MDLITAVQELADTYPSKNVTASTIRIYVDDLSDLPEPLVVAAIARLRKTNTFMPTIAEIRNLVVEAACGLPSESEAWQQVREAMRTHVPGQGPWTCHPLVLEAVKEVGTWELRNDDSGRAADLFRRTYRAKRASLIAHMQSGILPLPTLPPGDDTVLGIQPGTPL